MNRVAFISLLVMLAGCAATNPLPARFYNLSDATTIQVQLTNFRDGHGAVSAQLATGERLAGDYTITNTPGAPRPAVNSPRGQWGLSAASVIPGSDDPSWKEVFGYGKDQHVVPVGIGTMVGDKGTIFAMVFFYADTYDEVASGVARTSTGQWYRFHVGVNSDPK